MRAGGVIAVAIALLAACSLKAPRPLNVRCKTHEDCVALEARCSFDPARGERVCCAGPGCLDDGAGAVDGGGDVSDAPVAPPDVPDTAAADASLEAVGPSDGAPACEAPPCLARALTVEPARFDFGALAVDKASAPQDFTVVNAGTTTTGTLTVALTGAGAAQFSMVSSTCAAGLDPGGRCVVRLLFRARGAGGAAVATLGISDGLGASTAATLVAYVEPDDGYQSACRNLAAIWCGRGRECAPLEMESLFGRADDCPARMVLWCLRSFVPDSGVGLQYLKEVPSTFATIPCPSWRADRSILKGADFTIGNYQGRTTESCETSAQCAGLCRATGGCGFCTAIGEPRAPCDLDVECDRGLVCAWRQCLFPATEGRPCLDDAFCTRTLRCVAGRCAPLGRAGDPCTGDGQCDREGGLLCNQALQRCGRAIAGATWDARKADGTVDRCADGRTPVPGGGCLARAADGEPCALDGTGARCLYPAGCHYAPGEAAGRCRLPGTTTCARTRADPPPGGYPPGQDPWCPSPALPQFCPATAAGPAGCFPAGTFCPGIVSCGGRGHGCPTAGEAFDCQTGRCLPACQATTTRPCDLCLAARCCAARGACTADPACGQGRGAALAMLEACRQDRCLRECAGGIFLRDGGTGAPSDGGAVCPAAGTFGAASVVMTGAFAQPVIGDFDRDGRNDVAGVAGGRVTFLRGNGDGTFQAAVPSAAATAPIQLLAADLDGDGKLDLLGGALSIYPGTGDGRFTVGPSFPGLVTDDQGGLAVADFNQDGRLDVVVTSLMISELRVFLGATAGGLAPAVKYPSTGGSVSVTVGDVNGDGHLDVVTGTSTPFAGGRVLLGNGDGTFRVHRDVASVDGAVTVALVDVNRDGVLDLITNSGGAGVLIGRGDGVFGAEGPGHLTFNPRRLVIADFDRDGDPDLVGWLDGGVGVALGRGDGTFEPPVDHATQASPAGLTAGDLDGDGFPDLAVGTEEALEVRLNQGCK